MNRRCCCVENAWRSSALDPAGTSLPPWIREHPSMIRQPSFVPLVFFAGRLAFCSHFDFGVFSSFPRLASLKCCLDEGLDAVAFEKALDLGGVWNYDQQIRRFSSTAYASLTLNSSTDMMSFSDYPFPFDVRLVFSSQRFACAHHYLDFFAADCRVSSSHQPEDIPQRVC